MADERQSILVIHDRPFISVDLLSDGSAVVEVCTMTKGMGGVETESVTIPAECLEDVAKALLSIIGK